jgi:hypothetical protein
VGVYESFKDITVVRRLTSRQYAPRLLHRLCGRPQVPSCQICFEAYGDGVVPRILTCGHSFCEDCLSKMLRYDCLIGCGLPFVMDFVACVCIFLLGGAARPLPASGGSKQLECPTCRKPTAVRGGRATELLANYAIMGA